MSAFTPPIRRVNRGRGHSYEDAHGRKVPGVTTVLKSLPKDGLISWAANATADYVLDNWRQLATSRPSERAAALRHARYDAVNKAAGKGKVIHSLGERLVIGAQVNVPDGLEGYVDGYVDFLDQHDVSAVHIEGVVASYDDPVYAGTFDLIADLTADLGDGPFRSRWLLDLKTGKGVYGEMALQLAAYRYAPALSIGERGNWHEIPMPDVDNVGVVHLSSRQLSDGTFAGSYQLLPVIADLNTFEMFAKVYQQWEILDELKLLVGEPALPPSKVRRMQLTPVPGAIEEFIEEAGDHGSVEVVGDDE